MQLVPPSTHYKESYLSALEEAKGESGDTFLDMPKDNESFEEFVTHQVGSAQGLYLPEGWVPATILWLVDNNEFIGRVSIRNSLTPYLLELGGHIGYWIRPSKRQMGYGKEILRLALPEAKKIGLTKVLVTCDETNIGSRKIIEENGGILENIVHNDGSGIPKRRYWITMVE